MVRMETSVALLTEDFCSKRMAAEVALEVRQLTMAEVAVVEQGRLEQ